VRTIFLAVFSIIRIAIAFAVLEREEMRRSHRQDSAWGR